MKNRTPPQRQITQADLDAAQRLRQLWAARVTDLGISQEKAGESTELGMTQAAISQFLSGRVALGTDATLKFAAYLKVHPVEIRPDLETLLAPASGPATIDAVARQLPPAARRNTLNYLRFELERNRALIAREDQAAYSKAVSAVDALLRDLDSQTTQ